MNRKTLLRQLSAITLILFVGFSALYRQNVHLGRLPLLLLCLYLIPISEVLNTHYKANRQKYQKLREQVERTK